MDKEYNILEDLIIACLAVYKYPLDKAYKHIDSLREQGLFNHQNFAQWDSTEIGNMLKKAGYDRGGINYIISERLEFLGKLVNSTGIKKFEKLISSNDNEKVKEYLLSIKGIGEKIINNFFTLRDS